MGPAKSCFDQPPPPHADPWLDAHGARQLESLFRSILFLSAQPLLLVDGDRTLYAASTGICKLLGLHLDQIVGRRLDDFTAVGSKSGSPQRLAILANTGRDEGPINLTGLDGTTHPMIYAARMSVLPARNVLAFRNVANNSREGKTSLRIPASAQDYAALLMDADGHIISWYSGAERMFGYRAADVTGNDFSFLRPSEDSEAPASWSDLERAGATGHFGRDRRLVRKDRSQFWANSMTVALKSDNGDLRGFGCIVRDLSERHEYDEALRVSRAKRRGISSVSTVAGVVYGEFDRITEVTDSFLELTGYTRADMLAGTPSWLDLTPPEYLKADEIAHEEGLLFGGCTPFEKECIRKDGTRVPILTTTAIPKLCPFRWVTFVQDLSKWDWSEDTDEDEEAEPQEFPGLIGNSPALRRVKVLIEAVAPTDSNVLILGETGTGKELVARSIHRLSPRRNMPFISLNCAAIPTGLLESELFGYERGAFTGALAQKVGRFELAHRGTLFLDEVGDIPMDIQPKLLRALQEKSLERLGGTKAIPIDVRLVAATNRDLTQMIGDKLFRSDLYYRLKVYPILTPPLRDRPEDIPLLAEHFMKLYADKMSKRIDRIPPETMRALVDWPWPGNIRELENFIERSVIGSKGLVLRAPLEEIRKPAERPADSDLLEKFEREHIIRVLRDSGGVVTTAATRLGLHRTTLNGLMVRLGISRRDFKASPE